MSGTCSTFSDEHPEVPWTEIVGLRHKVVHDDLGVDEDIVWQVVTADLPKLVASLEQSWRHLPPRRSESDLRHEGRPAWVMRCFVTKRSAIPSSSSETARLSGYVLKNYSTSSPTGANSGDLRREDSRSPACRGPSQWKNRQLSASARKE